MQQRSCHRAVHARAGALLDQQRAIVAWLGNQLDASRRSQILFVDRDDLLNLYAVSGLDLSDGERSTPG
jgi:hypothetical protein